MSERRGSAPAHTSGRFGRFMKNRPLILVCLLIAGALALGCVGMVVRNMRLYPNGELSALYHTLMRCISGLQAPFNRFSDALQASLAVISYRRPILWGLGCLFCVDLSYMLCQLLRFASRGSGLRLIVKRVFSVLRTLLILTAFLSFVCAVLSHLGHLPAGLLPIDLSAVLVYIDRLPTQLLPLGSVAWVRLLHLSAAALLLALIIGRFAPHRAAFTRVTVHPCFDLLGWISARLRMLRVAAWLLGLGAVHFIVTTCLNRPAAYLSPLIARANAAGASATVIELIARSPAIAAAIVLLLLFLLVYRPNSPLDRRIRGHERGMSGESAALKRLLHQLDPGSHVFTSLHIPNAGGGSYETDIVIVSTSGVFLTEVKNRSRHGRGQDRVYEEKLDRAVDQVRKDVRAMVDHLRSEYRSSGGDTHYPYISGAVLQLGDLSASAMVRDGDVPVFSANGIHALVQRMHTPSNGASTLSRGKVRRCVRYLDRL